MTGSFTATKQVVDVTLAHLQKARGFANIDKLILISVGVQWRILPISSNLFHNKAYCEFQP